VIIQNFLPPEIFTDSKLVAILMYAFTKAKSQKSTFCLDNDEVIDINPFQVVYAYNRLKIDLGMEKDEFEKKLQKVQHIKKVIITKKENVALIQSFDIETHVTSIHFHPEETEGQSISLSQWINIDLESYLRTKSKSHQTNTAHSIRQFINVVGDLALSQVTRKELDRFINAERGRIENSSLNDYTRSIKASIRRAWGMGYIPEDPFKGLKQLPEPRKKIIIWEESEIALLLEKVKENWWLEWTIWIALFTGMRRGELMNSLLSNIDMEEKLINIRNTEVHQTKFFIERQIPMCPDLVDRLKDIDKYKRIKGIESQFLICDNDGVKITDERPTKEIRRIVLREGLRDGLSFHGFRRTFATTLRRNNVPRRVISAILGHKNEDTTNRYLGIPQEDLYDAVANLSTTSYLSKA
jgi:integrase